MAKGFNRLHKFCSSASTSIEQRIDLESEGHKLGLEKNKFQAIKPTEKNCRRRPENLIRKLFFTAINFKPRNEERRKSNMYEYKSEESQNSSIHMSQIVPTSIIARQPTFESQNDLKELANGESKPKGILKKTEKNYSFCGPLDESWGTYRALKRGQSYHDKNPMKNSKENHSDSVSHAHVSKRLSSASASSAAVKNVTFSDMISPPKYRTSKSMPGMVKLSEDQDNDLPSLYLTKTMQGNSQEEDSIDSLQLKAISFCEPSENNSSNNTLQILKI